MMTSAAVPHSLKPRRSALAALLGFITLGRVVAQPTLQQRKEKIKSMDAKISAEATARKQRSERILRAEQVPLNTHLPVIETEAESKRRTKDEIAYRALSLLAVAVKGEGLEQKIVQRIVSDYALQGHFSPKESSFIQHAAPSRTELTQFSWRYEAAWVMLWALGFVERLGRPDAICDVQFAVRCMKERSTPTFLRDARLRPLSDFLDEADLIYRYHWAVVDARINGRPAPAGLNPGVTLERHYALNWLVGYMNQDWDDVSTDT